MASTAIPAKPAWGRIMRHGFAKHCARCGSGHLFEGWFRLREHCPRCGMKFEREEGAFTGVYLLNFGVALFLLWALMMVYIGQLAMAEGEHVNVVPIGVAALVVAIVFPVVFYPFAKTIWIAIHLGAEPLSPAELAEAEEHRTVPYDELSLTTP
ncbi:MAG: DUF983 domain-containing protein [Aquihabitans sp.]